MRVCFGRLASNALNFSATYLKFSVKKAKQLLIIWKYEFGEKSKGPCTRAIFVAMFLILTHAIEWLNHKSIDLYSLATDGLIHS